MVHPRRPHSPPSTCYLERSDRRFRPCRKGSALLSPVLLSSSADSVLRKTRHLTDTDPSATLSPIPTSDSQPSTVDPPSPAPFLATRHSPLATIPFRVSSFANPHPLTLIESHLYKKQGRGPGIRSSPTLPLFSTTSKHPTHSNSRKHNLFIHLPHGSLDTQGVGGSPFSLRGCAHSASLRYPFPRLASPPCLTLGALDEP
jgi:hypothetical protein